MEYKVCTRCKKKKKKDEFYPRKDRPIGIASWCKDCCKSYDNRIYNKVCKNCGKDFKGVLKNKYCSKNCYYQNIKGRRLSPSTEFKKGHKNSVESIKKTTERMRGNKYWMLVKNRPKGENHIHWKGGITEVRKKFWDSSKYKKWRKEIFERDNYTCQECGLGGVYIEVHHIKEREIIFRENNIKTLQQALDCEELWDKNNGTTLCKKCHNLTKKNVYEKFIKNRTN